MTGNQIQLVMPLISERVKRVISQNGLTQKQVASSVGLSEQVFSNKINNLRPFSLKDLAALADFFGVSVDYLTGRTNDPVVAFPAGESL